MEEKLAKYFSGEATEEEIKEIHNWRSANDFNSSSFLEAKNVWIMSSLNTGVNQSMLESILTSKDTKEVPMWKYNFLKLAASILIILGVTFAIYQTVSKTDNLIVADKTTEETLPDGTIVTLYKGASIVVGDFKKTRNIVLTGRAYFDVKRDEKKPFIITSEKAKVEVLGTSFVVDTEKEEVEVLVESGLVAFSTINESSSIELSKGEMGSLNDGLGTISRKSNDNKNYLAWKTRALDFDGVSMGEVASLINEVYDIEIIFKNKELETCKLNGQYKNKSSKEVINIIAQTFDFSVGWEGNTVTLDGNACD